MRGQRFGQDCLLVSLLKYVYGISHDPFSFGQSIFGDESSSPRFIDLSDRPHVAQAEKQVTSTVKMLVCFLILPDLEEQITKVVFYPGQIAGVPGLLKMETRSRVFHQCAIQIVFSIFGDG